MTELRGRTRTTVRCEHDRLLEWLRELLRGSDGVNVDIVLEETSDARTSVRITVHDVPGPLAGLDLRLLT